MNKKTVILGASFNPVHNGHLWLADYFSQQPAVEKVVLLPCGKHAFDKNMLPAANRLAMLKLAVADYPQLVIDEREIKAAKQGQISYTYPTLVSRQQDFPEEDLVFILGSENLTDFDRWDEADKLATDFELWVVVRPGYEIDEKHLKQRYPRLKVVRIPGWDKLLPISSTLIRQKIKTGESIDQLTPPAVADYIKQHRLYE